MSAATSKPTQLSKTSQPGAAISAGKQASILLEKGNPGLRRATPDSEALASSDDEIDHAMSSSMISNPPTSKPVRRTSWLNEIPSTRRKPSITFGGPISPTNSHPATPPADTAGWPSSTAQNAPSSTSRTLPSQASYPWGTGIWNDGKKDAPSRLQEVLASPTSNASTNGPYASDEFSMRPSSRGTLGSESSFPLPIPLHPTPKTYRSQSYSVGQLDQDAVGAGMPTAAGSRVVGRGRAPQYNTLQHRSSRQSALGDFGHESGMLGQVREDEDDDEELQQSRDSQQLQSQWEKPRGGQLTKENMAYRPVETAFRNRTLSSASAASSFQGVANIPRSRLYGGGLPDTDEVVEDTDEYSEYIAAGQQGLYGRRYSEHYADNGRPSGYSSQAEIRNLENVRRAQWQTSLGFGSIPEVPQSRRHSFADMPTRHGSISSVHDQPQSLLGLNSRLTMEEPQETAGLYSEDALSPSRGDSASYFAGEANLRSNPRQLHQAYAAQGSYGRGHHGTPTRHDQPLFVVTFKAQRADVFYIQEDTGLEVNNGDLVIVEADRGTDLGTVAAANVSWENARTIKAQLSEEHYKWLMLFSRQGQNGGSGAVNSTSTLGGSAVGGMGPPGTHGLQEPQSGDLKPKLIKRLAQNHEIQTLREKEGNEAKAKRVCQQKVAEHRLNMEILDAEFQMDWKKLTFYYFADAYINFNSLVTDLFKIYKTRIWMSAINPDSFISPPSAGLSMGSPGGMGNADRDIPVDRRRQMGLQSQTSSPGFMTETADPSRNALLGQNPGLRGAQPGAYQPLPMGYQTGIRQNNYAQHIQQQQQQPDPFNPYLRSPYAALNQMPDYPLNAASNGRGRSLQSPEDWTTNFQGLSLGS